MPPAWLASQRLASAKPASVRFGMRRCMIAGSAASLPREPCFMRKLLVVGALLTAIVGALAIAIPFFRPGQFSRFNFDRINAGMKLSDVELLLGAPGAEITAN